MRAEKGYTLVEVLMVVVIIGIGFSIAVPSFQGMQERNRLVTQTNDLVAAIGLARSEANRRGAPVTLMAAVGASGNEFGGGYCIVDGSIEDASPPTDCSGTVIRRFNALVGDSTLAGLDNDDDGGDWDAPRNAITFNSLGGLDEDANEGQMRYLDLCHPNQLDRRFQIRLIGRVKVWREAEPGTAAEDIPSIQPDCS
ncbi:MAG: GspH/FimT family pseudopilin [Pseudomonadales bacterium]|nr:GspH/FimT family pseudopilin [Pseudomonadales bacterium]